MIPCHTKLWRPSAECEAYFAERKPGFDGVMRKECGRDASPYEFFLKTFGDLPLKHPLKHEFLILCWQQQWGTAIQIESHGILNHWLVRMARGLCFSKRLYLMGCGSSGKTKIVAAYCYTLWKARPFNASVFLSTTSAEAGESRTWGAVKDWHKIDRYKVGKRIETLHLITLDEEIRDEDGVKERDFRDVIKCVNIKPGQEGKNVMAAIVGRKNDIVVWACDELNFMDVGVRNARVNLNTNPFNQFIGMFNAPEEGDPAYIDATPFGPKYPDGWRSVDKDIHESWTTETGLCLYFNGAKSPNFLCKDSSIIPFPRLMNEVFRLEIKQDSGGEDSPMYWKQFYGFPPSVDISDKAFTHKLLETYGAFDEVTWLNTEQKALGGLDLGHRADGDPNVIHFGRIGKNLSGRTILGVEADGITLVPNQRDTAAFEVQISRRVIQECRSRVCHDIALDVSGDGGVLLQHIEREARAQGYQLNVLAVSFGGSPEDRIIIPGETRTAREMFDRMVSQLWLSLRVSVLNRVIFGMNRHSKSVSQLCARKMNTDEKKRMSIEKKTDMKKRLRRSPDEADSTVILHALALRHGLAGMEVKSTPKPFDPVALVNRQQPGAYRAPQRSVYGGR